MGNTVSVKGMSLLTRMHIHDRIDLEGGERNWTRPRFLPNAPHDPRILGVWSPGVVSLLTNRFSPPSPSWSPNLHRTPPGGWVGGPDLCRPPVATASPLGRWALGVGYQAPWK